MKYVKKDKKAILSKRRSCENRESNEKMLQKQVQDLYNLTQFFVSKQIEKGMSVEEAIESVFGNERLISTHPSLNNIEIQRRLKKLIRSNYYGTVVHGQFIPGKYSKNINKNEEEISL